MTKYKSTEQVMKIISDKNKINKINNTIIDRIIFKSSIQISLKINWLSTHLI